MQSPLPDRAVGLTALAVLGLGALAQPLPQDFAVLAALKVLLGTLAVGVVPGFLIAARWRPGPRWQAAELIAASVALSLALVQVPCVVSVGFHYPMRVVAPVWLGLWAVVALSLVVLPRGGSVGLRLPRGEGWVLLGLLAVACLLYVKGSPFFSDEEQIHVSIVRRLSAADRPARNNLYHAPGIVYTHPYPGTHYFIGAVAMAGGIDSLFVYHKLRFFWGAVSLLLLYRAAQIIFRRQSLALVSISAAAALMLNGSLADFGCLYWAQLAPNSHPSDVALGVLLPASLVLALSYIVGPTPGRARFYLAAAGVMIAMLGMVHLREVVQLLVYLGCFLLACLVYRSGGWSLALRAALLLGIAVLVGFAYTWHHHRVVGHVVAYDHAQKEYLRAALRSLTWHDLIKAPWPHMALSSIYQGWNTALSLLAPLVLLAFWRGPLVRMVCASVLAFLVLIRLPLLSFPFTLVTFCEALVTPVRLYSYFLAMLAGPAIYVVAVNLARIPGYTIRWGLATAVGLGFALFTRVPVEYWMRSHDRLFAPAFILFGAALGLTLWHRTRNAVAALGEARPGWAPVFAALLVPAAAMSALPTQSPLDVGSVPTATIHYRGRAPIMLTPRATVEGVRCSAIESFSLGRAHGALDEYGMTLVGLKAQVPSRALITWARRELPPGAILAVNSFNACAPTLYLPQQINAWPSVASFNLAYIKNLFPAYYRHFGRAMQRYHEQPFFNCNEGLAERLRFVDDLSISHVLLDPMYRDEVLPELLKHPGRFRVVFDDGRWTVVEVVRS